MRSAEAQSGPSARLAVAVLLLSGALAGRLHSQAATDPRRVTEPPLEVKVLVLNFDPLVPGQWGQRLHEACRWNDPRMLSREYARDVEEISGGFIHYREVAWRDIDTIPVKQDGFQYSVEQFLELRKAGKGWHMPDGANYRKMLADFGVAAMVDRGEVDEVWLHGGPYFGYFESAMAGPGAFEINGGVFDDVPSKRPFAIMGFNYERGVNSMLHDLCHRTEATMARVFGGWKSEELTSDWARFAANAKQSGGEAGAGSCHYPANAERDYDYASPREVMSSADDWLLYPNLTGRKAAVSAQNWGGPDYERNYLKWWFTRLPRAPGANANGRLNNWWRYVFDFHRYTADGRPK